MYEDLKEKLLQKIGVTTILPHHCKLISKDIYEVTRKHISETTLKRFFGLAAKNHKFSSYTLDALQIYTDDRCEVSISTKIDSPTAKSKQEKSQFHLLDSTIQSTNCGNHADLNKLDNDIIPVDIKLNRLQVQKLKNSIEKVNENKTKTSGKKS